MSMNSLVAATLLDNRLLAVQLLIIMNDMSILENRAISIDFRKVLFRLILLFDWYVK